MEGPKEGSKVAFEKDGNPDQRNDEEKKKKGSNVDSLIDDPNAKDDWDENLIPFFRTNISGQRQPTMEISRESSDQLYCKNSYEKIRVVSKKLEQFQINSSSFK